MASTARIDELRKKFDENPRRYFAPLANEYRKAGDLEQAIFICQEYLPQQPAHMSGHIVYGQALFESGRDDEARAVFETALNLDPENLIALRHLGDIARQAGDIEGARSWYKQVLEVDPRNEDIAQLIVALETTTTEAAGGADVRREVSAPSPNLDPAHPHIAEPSVARSETDDGDADGDQGFVVESFARDLEMAPPPPPVQVPPEPSLVSPPASHESELLDIEDFSLGAFASPSGDPPASVETPEAEFSAPVSQSSTDDEPADRRETNVDPHADVGGEELESAFEFDPLAIAHQAAHTTTEDDESDDAERDTDVDTSELHEAFESAGRSDETYDFGGQVSPPEASIEAATDVRLELPPDQPVDLEEPVIEAAAVELNTEDATHEPSVARDEGSHGTLAEAAAEFNGSAAEDLDEVLLAETVEMQSFAEPAVEEQQATPDVVDSVPEIPSASPAPPEAFVTETMADLYLQQGHTEAALEIYHKLVEQKPEDPGLRQRLRLLEDRLAGRSERPTPPMVESEAPPPTAAAGPTIREFLRTLLVEGGSPDLFAASSSTSSEELVLGESESAEDASSAAGAASEAGTIDALFPDGTSNRADMSAASTLAAAFAPEAHDPTPVRGVPAHTAKRELSLDDVFKRNSAPTTGEPGGFSFDQFFAEETSGGASSGGSTPASPPADDIAQFNAWLNGLKKT